MRLPLCFSWTWFGGALTDSSVRGCSKAGVLSQYAYEYLKDGVKDVMPALGTHVPMTDDELTRVRSTSRFWIHMLPSLTRSCLQMYGDIPKDRFRVHDWRYGENQLSSCAHLHSNAAPLGSETMWRRLATFQPSWSARPATGR